MPGIEEDGTTPRPVTSGIDIVGNDGMGLGRKFKMARGYLRGIGHLQPNDFILASFPRSGNTWLRFLLANTVCVGELDGRQVDFHLLNRMMPELGVSDLGEAWPYGTVPRVIKTHQRYWPFFRQARSILVVRDPRDAMVSHYHYVRNDLAVGYAGSFEEFVRSWRFGLDSWFRHYASWRGRCGLLLRYEDLRRDTPGQFGRLLGFLGARVPAGVVEEAIRRSDIGSIRRIEEESENPHGERHPRDFRFTRNGRSRQWVDMFTPELVALYERMKEKYRFTLY